MKNLDNKNLFIGKQKEFGHKNEPIEQVFESGEGEADRDAGSFERDKIEIPAGMSSDEIQEKYNVSRTTAWRAKERGWIFLNYHKKLIDIDGGWAEKNVEKMRKAARIGSLVALRQLKQTTKDLDDLISEAYLRLYELSGHSERDSDKWLIGVAKNAALNFLNNQIEFEKAFWKSRQYIDEDDKEME